MQGLLKKVFGDANAREIARLLRVAEEINSLESEISALSPDDLKAKTHEFRERLKEGGALDDMLPEAFACVREAALRTLGQRHFDAQLLGGMVLHEGKIAEMKTGEGKTLAATAPAYLNALLRRGVHIVTVNDYLARRDTIWMGQIYHALGMSVGCIAHDSAYVYDPAYTPDSQEKAHDDAVRDTVGGFKVIERFLRPVSRKEAYAADITYGTNNEFGFDFLRDNMATSLEQIAQKTHYFAIVDEVDSILIDEARTPLIISAPDEESTRLYDDFARVVPRLRENVDYNVDEKLRAVTLTDEGVLHVEKILGMSDLFTERGLRHLHHLEQALRATVLFKKDRDYVVREGEVMIVDEFTGRLMSGRRYSEGLHQAIEAKEGVRVQQESRTLATITFQNYFRMYEKLAGMTGTAATSAEELHKVYKLDVVVVPTNKLMIRKDISDAVYKNELGKFKAVVREVQERNERGQPVLIGTISIERNEKLSAMLSREGITHHVLNAKHHEQEAEIIAQAGKKGAVTIATNMAGRGVDIILGGNPPDQKEADAVREAGGLHVIGTERHEARRIDNQLRGRSGRQGDPGSSQFFVSLEDDLMRIFGGDRIKGLMERFGLPEDQPIENRLISGALESAQAKIEGHNFDLRKHILEYDDVMNKHREVIYRKRHDLLGGKLNALAELEKILTEQIEEIVKAHCEPEHSDEWNIEGVVESCSAIVPLPPTLQGELMDIKKNERLNADEQRDEIRESLVNSFTAIIAERRQSFGEEVFSQAARFVFLRTIDMLWMDHLEAMEALRDSVRLRAYGQRDPLVEYKSEGHRLFRELLALMKSTAVRMLFRVQHSVPHMHAPHPAQYHAERPSVPAGQSNMGPGSPHQDRRQRARIGRNDPCPCGSGKKYKKCHGK